MEGVASADPSQGQPPTPPCTEAFDRRVAVLRAGWLVPAAAHHPEQRTDGHAVDPDQQEAEAGHRFDLGRWAITVLSRVEGATTLSRRCRARVMDVLTAALRASNDNSEASEPATMTASWPAREASRGRTASRSRRRSRLRRCRRGAWSAWRPRGVDIRMRNPWVLRRYFFLGW